MQEQDKQIFEGYEIKSWNFSPRIYKIMATSAILNLFAIIVFAQTNLLTRKGCESPLVSSVCQVLDTVYVGSMIFGTDSEFVSKDYEKTELEDAEITYIDVSGQTPPLEYPEGYFALANPEQQFQAMQNMDGGLSTPLDMTGFPTNPAFSNGTDLLGTPQVTPTPNNNAVTGPLPTTPFDFGSNPTLTKRGKFPKIYTPKPPKAKNSSPKELPKLDGDETAENKDKTENKDKKDEKQTGNKSEIESDAVADVEINKKPFEDLGDLINVKIEKKEVDLTKPFLIVMDGAITKDGKLDRDPKKSRFVKFDGDKQMLDVAREAIQAVGDSGFLGYLKNQGIDRVTFSIEQNDKQIYVKIISDQKTPEKAATTASGLNTMLSAVIIADKNGWKKLDERSRVLVSNAKVTNEGKNFVFDFSIPKQEAQDIINRSLKERAEKKAAGQQPNSTAQNDNANQKTGK